MVKSGVPKGTVLGPLLFLICINDIESQVTSSIHLFADDSALCRPIYSESDSLTLQEDISKLQKWASTWQMTLNVNKYKLVHITYSKSAVIKYMFNIWFLLINNCYRYVLVFLVSKSIAVCHKLEFLCLKLVLVVNFQLSEVFWMTIHVLDIHVLDSSNFNCLYIHVISFRNHKIRQYSFVTMQKSAYSKKLSLKLGENSADRSM